MKNPLPRLHAVTDDQVLSHTDFLAHAAAVTKSPVALHLRSSSSGKSVFELAEDLKDMCDRSASLLFINDRVDIAKAVLAHGVHLPASGLPVGAARNLAGPNAWIGCSVHSATEATRAGDDGADYVFLGPIWRTTSHPDRPPIGIGVIEHVRNVKVIAIGGINAQRAPTCLNAGAHGVAAVSAIWHAQDPSAAVRALLLSLQHDRHDDCSGQR